ncbi:MAG: polysaccharide biosynthesis tyrosine autokinase [Deltaproteobacteria bacterium]|nr:polysaccharide biosynthesis tyrosine autokinase [Deltaproteobacteria bacterium]
MSHSDSFLQTEQDGFSQTPDMEFDVKDYLFKLLRHWRLILVAVVLCLGAAFAKFVISPEEFQTRAVVQIERRSLTPLIGTQNPWLENYWNMEFYPTQEKLLQSRGLAEQVVRQLRLTTDPAFGGSPTALNGQDQQATAAADQAAVAGLAGSILGGLTVRRVRETQLVELIYTADSAHKAALLANGFAQAFIDMGIEYRGATAGKASTFLGAEIEKLRAEIAEKEGLLQEVSRRSDIVALDPESNTTLQRLKALNQDFSEAQNLHIQKQAYYRELLTTPAEALAESVASTEVSQQRSALRTLEQDYQSKLAVYKPEWHEMVDLKARIDKARQSLNRLIQDRATQAQEAARGEFQAAERQKRALEAEISNLKDKTLDQKSSRLEFINLEDEVNTRRQLLNQLLQRQSETAVTARLQDTRASNVRIVDTALVPGGPFRPSLRRNLTLGMAMGLFFGVGLAALLELLDRTIKTSEELESVMGLPTLAVIPDIFEAGRSYGYRGAKAYGYGAAPAKASKSWRERRSKNDPQKIELLPHEQPRLAVSEAYRSLRTALLLSTAEELRMIAVTSAEAGEGKTATASNLAVVMSQLDRNVLIIDGDLRKPRQHQLLKQSNRVGLVSYLTGTAEPEDILFPTVVENLYLCPSGPIPPNPSELLSSDKMREFLLQARKRFDFVIVDTPPTLAVTDSTLIGSMTDGVVLCCRAGSLVREDARACRDRLLFSDIRVLGAVLNGFRANSSRASYARKHRYYESYVDDVADSRTDSAA